MLDFEGLEEAKELLISPLEAEGYDARQIGMKLIVPQMGRKVSKKALSRKMIVSEETQHRLKLSLLRKKGKAKSKAKPVVGAEAGQAAEEDRSVSCEGEWVMSE